MLTRADRRAHCRRRVMMRLLLLLLLLMLLLLTGCRSGCDHGSVGCYRSRSNGSLNGVRLRVMKGGSNRVGNRRRRRRRKRR